MRLSLLMTWQHRETMEDLIHEFGIRTPITSALPSAEHASVGSLIRWLPAAYRGVMRHLRMMSKESQGADVIVHGDTLSTVLGAVAGWRSGARVIHVESGLTSGRLFDPFPEELFRRIVFRFVDVALCPDKRSAAHMRSIGRYMVLDTGGNTILDAVKIVGAMQVERSSHDPYVVASLHRFQNIYDPRRLRELVTLLEVVARRYPVRFVLHPATRRRLLKNRLLEQLMATPNVTCLPRLGYGEFMRVAAGAACVLTDGGSNQEELAALGIPTIVMRKATERDDGIGFNVVMEPEVPGGVGSFLLSGGFTRLATPRMDMPKPGPSVKIAELLATGRCAVEPADVDA
jgi:UDP-N-acetylglucosamine 2-epimerase (non-hydrolysing)